jgi:hypothetical protein
MSGTLSTDSVVIAGGVSLSADASVVSGETISGSGTLSVTNLGGTLNADFASVDSATILHVDWSGVTGTYSGNLTHVDTLNISSGTMSVTDDIVSGHTVSGSGSLIVEVGSDTAFTWSSIADTLTTTLAFTGGTSYTQSISNVDAITLASGVSVDISGATIDSDTASVSGSSGNESLTLKGSFLDTLTSIDLGNGSDTLSVTGTSTLNAADFGKISHVETLNLTDYTGSADLTDTSGITQLNTGSNVNTTTIDYAMNINDTGGSDTLYTTSTMDLSTQTIVGIETLNVANTTTTTLDYGDLSVGGGDIATLEGSGSVAIHGTTSMDIQSLSVDALGNDQLGITGTASDDHLVLDFSQLDEISFNGNGGSDTVAINGITGGSTLDDTTAFNHIETLDLSSLSSATASISFDMLYSLAQTSSVDTDSNTSTYEINLNVDDVNYANLSITSSSNFTVDGGTASTSWALSDHSSSYEISDGINTFLLHVS